MILIYPTSLVLSLWVPQHASISTPLILTTLNWFPGTTPPWYKVNPYFFSASALFSPGVYTLHFAEVY